MIKEKQIGHCFTYKCTLHPTYYFKEKQLQVINMVKITLMHKISKLKVRSSGAALGNHLVIQTPKSNPLMLSAKKGSNGSHFLGLEYNSTRV